MPSLKRPRLEARFGETSTSPPLQRRRIQYDGEASRSTSTGYLSVPQLPNEGPNSAPDRSMSLNRYKYGKVDASNWSIQQVCGGTFNRMHPIFSLDENFLFSSYGNNVLVFSLSSSQTSGSFLAGDKSDSVLGLNIFRSAPDDLYVATSAGCFSCWHWKSGKQLQTWKTFGNIHRVDFPEIFGDRKELVILRQRKDGGSQISTSILDASGSPYRLQETMILDTALPVSEFRSAPRGMAVIALAGHHLLVGRPTELRGSNRSGEYDWREIVLPFELVALDLREYTISPLQQETPPVTRKPDVVDLAVGDVGGSIIVFPDIVTTLWEASDVNLAHNVGSNGSQRLHWHRQGVSSIRWSHDGQYLVSGGKEAVLVLWQLDSGRRTFLPHISSGISEINISPSGKLHALNLSDNSLAVISTAHMQQVAAFVGLQLGAEIPSLVDIQSQHREDVYVRLIPASLHPRNPNHVMLVVPARRPLGRRAAGLNLSMLQTFDVGTGNHISRQALTRTNVTVLANGPEGNEVVSPNIQHMDVSEDGSWLATVDTWRPDLANSNLLETTRSDQERVLGPLETFLKFWKWDHSKQEWTLVTQLETPHFQDISNSSSVLSLTSRPGLLGFATFGADGMINYWELQSQSRNTRLNAPIRGNHDSWKCRASVAVREKFGSRTSLEATTCSLAFSEDGSILALCIQGSICLIDTHTWEIRHKRKELSWSTVFAMGFVGRCLVLAAALSTFLWDIVEDVAIDVSTVTLTTDLKACAFEQNAILFAVNRKTSTYALVIKSTSARQPHKKSSQNLICKFSLHVYSLIFKRSVLQSTLENCPVALLSDPHGGGYVIVDTAAHCYTISSEDASPSINSNVKIASHSRNGFNELFGTSMASAITSGTSTKDAQEESISDSLRGSVELLETSSFALPAVDILFHSTVRSIFGSR